MAKKLDLDFVRLFDCYGALLTQRQRDVMELYYNEDYSLSECAAELGITRQAVSDSLRHSEQILRDTEEKLGLAEKLWQIRELAENAAGLENSLENSRILEQILELL